MRYLNVDLMLQQPDLQKENLCFPKQCKTKQADCINHNNKNMLKTCAFFGTEREKRAKVLHVHLPSTSELYCMYM